MCAYAPGVNRYIVNTEQERLVRLVTGSRMPHNTYKTFIVLWQLNVIGGQIKLKDF